MPGHMRDFYHARQQYLEVVIPKLALNEVKGLARNLSLNNQTGITHDSKIVPLFRRLHDCQ